MVAESEAKSPGQVPRYSTVPWPPHCDAVPAPERAFLRLVLRMSLTQRRTSKPHLVAQFLKKPFLFGKLATTDSDEAACQDEQIIKNLGTLQLRYLRVIHNGRWPSKHKFEVPQARVIHEKAKKAQLSHQAAFGEVVATSRRVSVYTHRIDPSSSPFSQFEFRYRSRGRFLSVHPEVSSCS